MTRFLRQGAVNDIRAVLATTPAADQEYIANTLTTNALNSDVLSYEAPATKVYDNTIGDMIEVPLGSTTHDIAEYLGHDQFAYTEDFGHAGLNETYSVYSDDTCENLEFQTTAATSHEALASYTETAHGNGSAPYDVYIQDSEGNGHWSTDISTSWEDDLDRFFGAEL